MKFPYFHLQLWDRDILKWNDCAGEGKVYEATQLRPLRCFYWHTLGQRIVFILCPFYIQFCI